MNERIKELATEARLLTGWPVGEVEYQKFAELIVQECMACSTWVGKMNTNSVEPVHTAHAINQRIKQQFGVEE
jgi:hypothetical protein